MPGLPNLLTLLRIALIPVVISLFYLQSSTGHYIAAALFILACVTDYLDGYYARIYHQTTDLGRFLDPIADKLLICSTLLLLVGFDQIKGLSLIPAIIILCREILVSGLREYLAEAHLSLPVSTLAKWKTGLQMTALSILIITQPGSAFFDLQPVGLTALWMSALLTLVTGYDYIKMGLQKANISS
ncbi:MAG: CDP-diacylglycerol--glycerol-3-phosphate 3-phosphatidyltransferase [Janthinobacterium lividum]